MKMISITVAGLGVLALILAIVERLGGFQIMGLAPISLLRGAMTLYLLALVLMIYEKVYGAPAASPKP
jgi:hypothetical protein